MQTQTQSANKARTQTAKQIVGFSRISRELISQDFTFKSNQTGKQKRDPSSECGAQLGGKTKKNGERKKKKTLSCPPLTRFSAFSLCARTQLERLEMLAVYPGKPAGKHANMCPSAPLARACTHAGDNGAGGGWRGEAA